MKDRTVKILRKFLDSDIPIYAKNLSDEFNISSRTLHNEIIKINTHLEDKELPTIQNIRGKGYLLSLNKSQIKELNRIGDKKSVPGYLTRKERIFDLILSFSLGKEKKFLYEKEKEYDISKSTLDEDMRRVRIILHEYGINVLTIPKKGTILQGTERTIRTMIYDIINRFVGFFSIAEDNSKETSSEKILYQYIPKSVLIELSLIYDESVYTMEDNIYRNQMVLFTAVWLSRFLEKSIITNNSEVHLDDFKTDIENFIINISDKLELTLPEVELKYITFMLETFKSKEIGNSAEWMQAQLFSIQLIHHVEKETKIPFSRKEEELQESLYKHFTGLINRSKNKIQIVNPLKESIKHNYSNIYTSIKNFIPVIENSMNIKLSEDEISFITIYFSTSVSAINQDLRYYYKAVVICNHGIATGKLLSENLKELFNIDVIAILSSRDVCLIEKLDIDVIFSTVKVEYTEKPLLVLDPIIKEESIVIINSFLKRNNRYKRLVKNSNNSVNLFYSIIDIIKESGGTVSNTSYESLENVFNSNSLKLNRREIQPMLKDILKDSNILLKEDAKDWRDSIRKVSIPLLQEEVIEERYVESMIQSVEEYGPYIVIGKNLALAHARPEDGVKKLGISVATLKKPIKFGNDDNDPVKIIFCLAAVDSYSHLNIMRDLVNLINDENKISQLTECENIKEFKEILYKEVNV